MKQISKTRSYINVKFILLSKSTILNEFNRGNLSGHARYSFCLVRGQGPVVSVKKDLPQSKGDDNYTIYMVILLTNTKIGR